MGLAIAELFAAEGAEIVITGRRAEKGSDAVRQIAEKTGRRVDFFPCDVTREGEVLRLVDRAVERLQRLDVLVNNAGIYIRKDFEATTEQEWDRIMNTNLRGAFFCCKHVVPHVMRNRRGSIINISSSVGLIGKSDVPIYSVSKGGLNLLTRSLALRYGKYNIRCNSICPGTIPTDLNLEFLTHGPDPEERIKKVISQYPLGRLGNGIDVAYAAVFLAADESGWVTGIALPVDGGIPPGRNEGRWGSSVV